MYLLTLLYLNEPRTGWASYLQLIQDLISGAARRHTFSQWELDLMLDLEVSRLRKSSRPEALRRYLRHLQAVIGEDRPPTRFSAFLEGDGLHRKSAKSGW